MIIKRPYSLEPVVNLRNPYGDAKAVRKASGVLSVDGKEIAETIQCGHCGGHFVSRKGSCIQRGICTNCMKKTCGRRQCDPCVHFLKKLDNYEKGLLLVLR